MKALVYTNTNEVIYRDEPDPVPGAGDVLIKMEATGICGSDMHAYHGHDARRVPPLILGHEIVGTIVDGPQAGTRIVINPLITCGQCQYCESGLTNLCPDRELIGMRLAGAYAENVIIPARNIIPISQTADPVKLALSEPVATALHALNLARVQSSRPLSELKVLIIGGGAIGLLAALLLKGYGNRTTTMAETNDLRRQSAADVAGCELLNPITEGDPDEGMFDLIIDAVGGAVTRKMGLKAVKPGGIFVHIGLMDSLGELDIRKLTLFEITLVGVYCYTAADMRAAAQAIESGLVGNLDWIETRPLSQGGKAFSDLDQGRCAAAKIVLIPG
ncbi:MAG: alcohol dehydrogenase catalytic domain-containing protein [SAR324 cluster bacterium]|nr:alcohol dehydrogenase catalytic domain-containing protein [SAR324 cluster bacterium]